MIFKCAHCGAQRWSAKKWAKFCNMTCRNGHNNPLRPKKRKVPTA